MIILDENIPSEERALLQRWHVRFRFVGQEIGHFGVKDPSIIRVLHGLKRPTFFARDEDFFSRDLCHSCYYLVWLNVKRDRTAETIRRILRHPRFRTARQRAGLVMRAHPAAIHYWGFDQTALQHVAWLQT